MSRKSQDLHNPQGERLQKVLAHAGVASRRAAEDMIQQGRVSVEGTIVRQLGIRVDPQSAVIHVDGNRVQLDQELITVALYKPPGLSPPCLTIKAVRLWRISWKTTRSAWFTLVA